MDTPSAKFSLLLVDDEPLVLSSLKRRFLGEPYDIRTALNGEAALLLMKRSRVDAAIVDLQMPGIGGIALLKEVCAAYPHVMTVVLTGHGGIKEAVEAMQAGARDFLEKPFSPGVQIFWSDDKNGGRNKDLVLKDLYPLPRGPVGPYGPTLEDLASGEGEPVLSPVFFP